MATAESITGGLVASLLVEVPGASRHYRGGVVAYTDLTKQKLLAVPSSVLRKQGAVSAAVARSMARGVCRKLACQVGLSLTGLAGPAGDPRGRIPVGTVFAGISLPTGDEVAHRLFRGDRNTVRLEAARWVLNLLAVRLAALPLPAAPGRRPRRNSPWPRTRLHRAPRRLPSRPARAQ